MPTGYTWNIKDGISFKDYALNCARAFGACVTMKDDPSDKPIPDEFKSTDYHKKEIDRIEKEIKNIISMSVKELKKRIEKEYKEKEEFRKERIKECKALRKKYDAMLVAVRNWCPPTAEHRSLGNFMEEQIRISYGDCDISYYEKPIEKLSVGEYRKTKLVELSKDLEYHMKADKEEEERVKGRNLWLKQLRESLED